MEAETALTGIMGVQGVGEGQDERGNPTWIAYVKDGSSAQRLPSEVAGRKVVPIVSGEISIQPLPY
jgi:hypothetical protein